MLQNPEALLQRFPVPPPPPPPPPLPARGWGLFPFPRLPCYILMLQ